MKASKQRKMARAIISNKSLKNSEAARITAAQSVVASNSYKYHNKKLAALVELFTKNLP